MVEKEVATAIEGEEENDDSISRRKPRRRATSILSTSYEDDGYEEHVQAALSNCRSILRGRTTRITSTSDEDDDDGEQVKAAASAVPHIGECSPRRAAVPRSPESPGYIRKSRKGIRFQNWIKHDLQKTGFMTYRRNIYQTKSGQSLTRLRRTLRIFNRIQGTCISRMFRGCCFGWLTCL
jgi:hypothetical protein